MTKPFDVEKARETIANVVWATADGGDAMNLNDSLSDACDEIETLQEREDRYLEVIAKLESRLETAERVVEAARRSRIGKSSSCAHGFDEPPCLDCALAAYDAACSEPSCTNDATT